MSSKERCLKVNISSTKPRMRLALYLSVLIVLLALAHVEHALADPVSRQQAETLVQNWLEVDPSPMGADLGGTIREVVDYDDGSGAVEYYVVFLDPAGFVIVSGDDLVEPIIAFSLGVEYDPSPQNPLGYLVTKDIPARLAQVRALVEDAKSKRVQFAPEGSIVEARNKWRMLLNDDSDFQVTGVGSISDVRIAPFIQTKWGQSNECGYATYNYYTPPNNEGSSSNYYCGCLATAMAQIMRYHLHPTAGVGTASFDIAECKVSQTRSLRGGDGAGGPYDWGNMPLDPDCSTTLIQRKAIGALCHDAAVAIKTDFCSNGSGAYMPDAHSAFKNVFGYNNVRRGFNNNSDIGSGLIGMINPNMDARLPVLLGIRDATNGHAVVCDGYGYSGSTLYHHLNLGWSGSYDAWYNLPIVDTFIVYDAVFECLYNIYVSGSGEIISGRITDASGNPIGGASVTATRSGQTWGPVVTDSRGIYALTKVPGGQGAFGNYVVSATHPLYSFDSQSASVRSSKDGANTSGNVWGCNFTGQGGPAVTQFAINSGAESTTSSVVTLNNVCSGSPSHYLASESSSFTGAVWQSYSVSPSFTLGASGGVKTVYFKVRNTYGTESSVVSDTINLIVDSTPPVTTATPGSGVYSSTQNVSLAANEPATIYYTLNGSEPNTGSTVYSSPILANVDTILRFFAVDTAGNAESPSKQENYWILTEEGSISAAKTATDGASVRLGNKALYLKRTGFGYVEELNRVSGIRIEGSIAAAEDSLVNLIGTMTTSQGERIISITALSASGAGSVSPVGVSNRSLRDRLLDGMLVRTWGVVKAGSIGPNSYIISDGSDTEGILILLPGIPDATEGEFVVVTGAAGFNGSRTLHAK